MCSILWSLIYNTFVNSQFFDKLHPAHAVFPLSNASTSYLGAPPMMWSLKPGNNNNNDEDDSIDDESLSTDVQEGVIAEDDITWLSKKRSKGKYGLKWLYIIWAVHSIALIDDWDDATPVSDIEPHISIRDKESLNFDDWGNWIFNSKA